MPIELGNIGEIRNVASIRDAADCMMSSKWPGRYGLMFEMAARALVDASEGNVTPSEARQAFVDAALEARVLVVDSFPT